MELIYLRNTSAGLRGLCGVFHICGPRKDRIFCYDLNQYIVKGIMY